MCLFFGEWNCTCQTKITMYYNQQAWREETTMGVVTFTIWGRLILNNFAPKPQRCSQHRLISYYIHPPYSHDITITPTILRLNNRQTGKRAEQLFFFFFFLDSPSNNDNSEASAASSEGQSFWSVVAMIWSQMGYVFNHNHDWYINNKIIYNGIKCYEW